MSRILSGTFTGAADPRAARPRDHVTLLDAMDILTPAQRQTMTGLIREFAGTVRKPRKGPNHRTRDLLAFLSSPALLDWFSVAQLRQLAAVAAVTAYERNHEEAFGVNPFDATDVLTDASPR